MGKEGKTADVRCVEDGGNDTKRESITTGTETLGHMGTKARIPRWWGVSGKFPKRVGIVTWYCVIHTTNTYAHAQTN